MSRQRNILLTGGRHPGVLELARRFHAAGDRVFSAESTRWHFLRGSLALERNFVVPSPRTDFDRWVKALTRIIDDHAIDLLLPGCEEIFFLAAARERLPSRCTIFADSAAKLDRLHNKWEFILSARAHGLAVPQTLLLRSKRDVEALDDVSRFVLKPVYSRFSARTILHPTPETVAAIEPTLDDPWVAQERLQGDQICTYSVAHRGVLSCHASYLAKYTLGAGASVAFAAARHPEGRSWVERFVREEDFTGQIAFDLIETERGVEAIECNPRLTNGVHLFARAEAFERVFDGGATSCLEPAGAEPMMLAPSMLAVLRGVKSRAEIVGWMKTFASSRDVVFRWVDPVPGLMTRYLQLIEFVRMGARLGIEPQRAATWDIEWDARAARLLL